MKRNETLEYWYNRLKVVRTKKAKIQVLSEMYNSAYQDGLWDN